MKRDSKTSFGGATRPRGAHALVVLATSAALCVRGQGEALAQVADAGPPPAPDASTETAPPGLTEPAEEAPAAPATEKKSTAANFGSNLASGEVHETEASERRGSPPEIRALPRTEEREPTTDEQEWSPAERGRVPSGLYFAPPKSHLTSWMFTVEPAIGVQFGSETYDFHASIPTSLAVDASVESKLSYPVGGALGGGTILCGLDAFSMSASVFTNVGNPWSTLLDQDFLSDGTDTLEFSHTDSPTTLRTLEVEGALRARTSTFADKSGSVHVVVGFRYEASTYDAYGAQGWQLDSDGNQFPVSIPADSHALHYEVRYRQPFVGIGLNGGTDSFLFSGEARLLASWSSHDDDHLLRHKVGNATAFGGGFGLRLEPMFAIGGFSGVRFFAGANAQLQVVGSFSGTLQQHYYADDPTLDGDQTTEQIPDAHFSFLSLRVRLLLAVAARF